MLGSKWLRQDGWHRHQLSGECWRRHTGRLQFAWRMWASTPGPAGPEQDDTGQPGKRVLERNW